jgi:hypothetical protein
LGGEAGLAGWSPPWPAELAAIWASLSASASALRLSSSLFLPGVSMWRLLASLCLLLLPGMLTGGRAGSVEQAWPSPPLVSSPRLPPCCYPQGSSSEHVAISRQKDDAIDDENVAHLVVDDVDGVDLDEVDDDDEDLLFPHRYALRFRVGRLILLLAPGDE